MDNPLILDRVKCVLEYHSGAILKLKNLLVTGSFCEHLTDDIKKQLREDKMEQVFIPGEITSLLQLLDICINWPIKSHSKLLQNRW